MLATWQYYLVGWIDLHNHLVFLLKSLYANRGHEGPKFGASNSLVSSFILCQSQQKIVSTNNG